MVVAFCGHAEIAPTDNVHDWLYDILVSLISNGADTFYLGGYGAFDRLTFTVLKNLKKTYPHIQIVLVLAYLNRNMDTSGYDVTLYPELEKAPPRFAISKRNEWMTDMADTVVAYVTHNWGGAAKTLQYARRKTKNIFCFSSQIDYLQ